MREKNWQKYQRSEKRVSGRTPVFVSEKVKYGINPIINLPLKFWGNIFLLLIVLFIIWSFFYSSFFNVKEVFVEGNLLSQKEEIINHAPLGKNIFRFDILEVKNSIKKASPIISDVEIYRGIPNALKIVVLEKKPSIVWQSQNKFYLVDETGEVVKEIGQSDFSEIIHITDQKNIETKIGQKILSKEFVAFANIVNEKFFTTTNIKISGWQVPETTFDLYVYTEAGFYVKFDTTRPAETQLENLQKILVAYRANIREYVDVRINGWAYYK